MQNRIIYAALACLGLWVPAANAGVGTVEFRFDLGGVKQYTQTISAEKVTTRGDSAPVVEKVTTVSTFTAEKVPEGWLLLATPSAIEMTKEGKRINNPILEMLSRVVATYHIDSNGKLIDITGFDAYVSTIKQQMLPNVFAALANILEVSAMRNRAVSDWNGRIGDFVGQKREIGRMYSVEVPYVLPSGDEITYLVRTTVTKKEPCAQASCVRIVQEYSTTNSALGKVATNAANGAAREMQKGEQDTAMTLGADRDTVVTGRVSRLIDPETMRIYEETLTREIVMMLNVAQGQSIPVKTLETKVYTFDY